MVMSALASDTLPVLRSVQEAESKDELLPDVLEQREGPVVFQAMKLTDVSGD